LELVAVEVVLITTVLLVLLEEVVTGAMEVLIPIMQHPEQTIVAVVAVAKEVVVENQVLAARAL
jgi:hypothetical protein